MNVDAVAIFAIVAPAIAAVYSLVYRHQSISLQRAKLTQVDVSRLDAIDERLKVFEGALKVALAEYKEALRLIESKSNQAQKELLYKNLGRGRG